MPNLQRELLDLTNELRRQHGLSQLKGAPRLRLSAVFKAKDMAKRGVLSHDTPDGPWFKIFDKFHVVANHEGQNIADGFYSAQSVFEAWLHSPEHYANLIKASYRRMGVGFAKGHGQSWWCQNFSS